MEAAIRIMRGLREAAFIDGGRALLTDDGWGISRRFTQDRRQRGTVPRDVESVMETHSLVYAFV
jgi:hypothetical protein